MMTDLEMSTLKKGNGSRKRIASKIGLMALNKLYIL